MGLLYFISGYLISMGVYLNLRMRSLNKAFKESESQSFLDFFEKEYLKKESSTFRRKYSFVYNSKIYSMANHVIGSMSIIIGVGILAVCLWIDVGGTKW